MQPLVVCNGNFEVGPAPQRFLLMRDGPLAIQGVELSLTPSGAGSILGYFQQMGNKIPIDYHHATVKVENQELSKAPAAGFVGGLEYVPGEGMYATHVEWTPEGRERVEKGEFRYHSPVIQYNLETKELIRLHSVALTNRPATTHMWELIRVAAELKNATTMNVTTTKVAAQVDADAKNDAAKGNEPMAPDIVLVAQLRALLGLAEDATLVDVLQAAIGHLDQNAKAAAEQSGKSAVLVAERAAFETMRKQLATLRAELDGITTTRLAEEVDRLIGEQIAAGKILPNDEKLIAAAKSLGVKDKATLLQFCEALPVLAPPGVISARADGAQSANKRTQLVAESVKEFKASKLVAGGYCKVNHFVNVALDDAGFEKLSAEETAKLEKI